MAEYLDLIDFHVPSPVLPNEVTVTQHLENDLISTDLPEFEQKLQTTSFPEQCRTNSVDIEDILIDIDSLDGDNCDVTTSDFLDLCEGGDVTSLPVDNFEALLVLKNLDDLLELEDGNEMSQEENTQELIEECLEDLDNYLEAFEEEAVNEDPPEFNEDHARAKLRQIEENYRKFVSLGIVNRAYIDTENNDNFPINERRPQSSCATLRPNKQKELRTRRTSLDCTHNGSAQWAPSSEVTRERHAHGSADCCTGTVIVEPLRARSKPSNSANLDARTTTTASPSATGGRTSWLRTSMRRLEQLALPNDVAPPPENDNRPLSAPSRLSIPNEHSRSTSRQSNLSRIRRSFSSSTASVVSSADSGSSHMPPHGGGASVEERRPTDHHESTEIPDGESPLGKWPHSLSSMMACLGCTLGLFNISRFSILTIHFGANFIFQFIILSLVFGLPLFTLQLCLGQQLGTGVIDMWKISPLFQGVGVSLLVTQALTGLYSIIGVSWMFVYFRDSFITALDKYRWAEPFLYYRRDMPQNNTYKLSETVSDYFNGVVLQRYHLQTGVAYGTIKFQLSFNLAVIWLIIFVSLSKGLRSYGKVIYVFTLLPVFGTFILCAKILGLMPPEYINIIFPETSWEEFFLNSRSWLAAAQETFLTWGLLGAAVMQISSHNKHKHFLQRDSSLVAVITITVLLLVAFLANTCVQIIKSYGYSYYPSSFEQMSSYQFLRYSKSPLPQSTLNTPIRYMRHNSFILGEKVVKPGTDHVHESGYQVLRLATELLPATFAIMGADQVSPFWAVLTYFIFIMFGISQQLAIWHCVITGIMAIKVNVLKKWESTITFFSCACGFIFGLPMATELGIYVVYFMDYVLGGIWWLSIVLILQIMAVFMVRGRPYSGDTIVTALFNKNSHSCFISWAPPLLSFTWNVILPVALMVLCIATFKNGNFREMFVWHHAAFADYWPLWARQVGSMMQLLPVLCIPLVAVIQSYRYLTSGPPDILDRIQLLYRPPIGEHMEEPPIIVTTPPEAATPPADPPPKYTPPPSYTTATGVRLAKFLRQSIRRSMRRIANVLDIHQEAGTSRTRPSVQNVEPPPPPDYNAVVVEMSSRNVREEHSEPTTTLSTLDRLRKLHNSPNALTAADVASILRSSFRRSRIRTTRPVLDPASHTQEFPDHSVSSLSAEHLVDAVAPVGETSLVFDTRS